MMITVVGTIKGSELLSTSSHNDNICYQSFQSGWMDAPGVGGRRGVAVGVGSLSLSSSVDNLSSRSEARVIPLACVLTRLASSTSEVVLLLFALLLRLLLAFERGVSSSRKLL